MKCFWCDGNPVFCVRCDKEIPCMFCEGSGEFTAEPKLPAHQCETVQEIAVEVCAWD
jgi:hypothetical protein